MADSASEEQRGSSPGLRRQTPPLPTSLSDLCSQPGPGRPRPPHSLRVGMDLCEGPLPREGWSWLCRLLAWGWGAASPQFSLGPGDPRACWSSRRSWGLSGWHSLDLEDEPSLCPVTRLPHPRRRGPVAGAARRPVSSRPDPGAVGAGGRPGGQSGDRRVQLGAWWRVGQGGRLPGPSPSSPECSSWGGAPLTSGRNSPSGVTCDLIRPPSQGTGAGPDRTNPVVGVAELWTSGATRGGQDRGRGRGHSCPGRHQCSDTPTDLGNYGRPPIPGGLQPLPSVTPPWEGQSVSRSLGYSRERPRLHPWTEPLTQPGRPPRTDWRLRGRES
ncbi:uncharacterized protein LOC129537066 isoform X2 [Moschus berezovskii]|uniref:uncharacterized protein LOC129537066 isoform X2 n=1 Tax=Moschus berezovskii TaxID=68408 RepID=UPI0024443740|nr:uncharacterized protein LOC129537066 isoform X2 [Moschus berezovskii]